MSHLSSQLRQIHSTGANDARGLATPKEYVLQNSIPSNLAARVQRSALHSLPGELTQMQYKYLPVFRAFVDYINYDSRPFMEEHPFFTDIVNGMPEATCRITHRAIPTL